MINNTSSLSTTLFCVASVATISIMGLFTTGCEDASRVEGVSWNANTPTVNAETTTPPAVNPETGNTEVENPETENTTTPGVDPYSDAVSYGSLNWKYGGLNGAGTSHAGVNLSSLRFSGNMLFFKYDRDLSAWGLSHGDAGAIACVFFMNTSGQWVGGKFDWISSSRTSRGLHHCFGQYSNWTMHDIPNPCQAAFVILSSDGKRRSNVLSATWSR